MRCPPLLHRFEALSRAIEALDAAGLPDLITALRERPSARGADTVLGDLARIEHPRADLAIRAVSAFAVVADELPDPPPPSLVVAVE